jgi:hypothetical protein
MPYHPETILLSDIVNYSLKGLLAALGKGNDISKSVRSLSLHIDEGTSMTEFIDTISRSKLVMENYIVVVPSKVVAILESRYVYGLTIENYNRCITEMDFAVKNLKTADDDPLTERDLIGLDKIDPARGIGVRYPKDPNLSAYGMAKAIFQSTGKRVDVVISDSDSGGQKGVRLIGCPTIMATPIGATKGLRLFYCMRAAVAAEATWNNIDNLPVLLVQPYFTHRLRDGRGELRYPGFLDASKEADTAWALQEARS